MQEGAQPQNRSRLGSEVRGLSRIIFSAPRTSVTCFPLNLYSPIPLASPLLSPESPKASTITNIQMIDVCTKSLCFEGLLAILKGTRMWKTKGKLSWWNFWHPPLKPHHLDSLFIFSYTYAIKVSEANWHHVINRTPQCKWSETQGQKQPFGFKYFSFLGLWSYVISFWKRHLWESKQTSRVCLSSRTWKIGNIWHLCNTDNIDIKE